MKYELADSVLFSENGKTAKGDILDVRGDFYVVHSGHGESLVSEDRIIESSDSFKEGGNIISSDSDSRIAEKINSMEFYRYYPIVGEPFKISYDADNTYGFGIYFLDDFDFYRDKFDNARFVTIKPNVKHPYVIMNHNQTVPSSEYSDLLNDLIKKGDVKDKDEFNNKLIKSGFDSIVVYDPRGIYLILLKEDESLFDVVSDMGVTQISFKDGGSLPSKKFNDYVMEEIINIISNDYQDITGYQGEILYRNFNEDTESFFIPSNSDIEYVSDLVKKDYLERDFEIVGNAYILTEKGKDLVTDVISSLS